MMAATIMVPIEATKIWLFFLPISTPSDWSRFKPGPGDQTERQEGSFTERALRNDKIMGDNFPRKPARMARKPARYITFSEKTRVMANTPMFSP